MILKQEIKEENFSRRAPVIGTPYKGANEKTLKQFYRHDPSLNQGIAGYRKGTRNPYVEKLMKM